MGIVGPTGRDRAAFLRLQIVLKNAGFRSKSLGCDTLKLNGVATETTFLRCCLRDKASLCIKSSAPLVPTSPQGTTTELQEAKKERWRDECRRRRVAERTEMLFVQKDHLIVRCSEEKS